MNIGLNSTTKNIITKTAITVALAFGTMVTTMMGYLCLGCIVGRILHPSTHEHKYVCACSEPPIMTQTEASVVGVIFIIGLMTVLFFILRQLKFSKIEQIIALIILLIANLCIASTIREILYIQITG